MSRNAHATKLTVLAQPHDLIREFSQLFGLWKSRDYSLVFDEGRHHIPEHRPFVSWLPAELPERDALLHSLVNAFLRRISYE